MKRYLHHETKAVWQKETSTCREQLESCWQFRFSSSTSPRSLIHAPPLCKHVKVLSSQFLLAALHSHLPILKWNVLSLGTALICLCIPSALCQNQMNKQNWGTTGCHYFKGTGAEYHSEVTLQTAATPSQGSIYSGAVRKHKTSGVTIAQKCSNTSSFFLKPRVSLILHTQSMWFLHLPVGASCFRQPLSTTEADNHRVLWEAVYSDFKGIPGVSAKKQRALIRWLTSWPAPYGG